MHAEFIEQDITTLVQQAITEVSSLLTDKNITINLNTEKNFDCMIDQKLIMQVIVNLFSNAIKFSPDNSIIDVLIQKEHLNGNRQEAIKITVFDQGIGIPENEINAIFDKFIQSSKTRSKAGGTGLGLPITKEIVELHNGEVWAESPPGSRNIGTAFYVVLPTLQGLEPHITFTNINDAINSHLEWRKVIDDICIGQEIPFEIPTSLISNEHLCSLGQWIDRQNFDGDSVTELKTIHEQFHSLAGEIIAYCEINNLTKAKAMQKEFHVASDKIVRLLSEINVAA